MFELNLNKTVKSFELNLEKAGFDLSNLPKLQVKLAVDKSGSMHALYNNGFVEMVVDLAIVAGMKFDDNQEIDVGFFNNLFHNAKIAKATDFGKYMNHYGNIAEGGTEFYPVLEAMYDQNEVKKPSFFNKLVESVTKRPPKPNYRTYLFIITDGENTDRSKTLHFLSTVDRSMTYVQFIGIGKSINKQYLESYATGDNVHVLHYPDPSKITADQFYQDICHEEFLNWSKQ